MYAYLIRVFKSERAATAVEYALMVALIALAIIVAVTALGGQLSALFNRIVTTLTGVGV
ncbi:MAG: Flp family type IVb pilin [Actinomycetota bacterium]|nr:Flp family type IVb pilin [Actinomycetota bacterium]